jgi:four helix bundle protein
MPRFERFEEIQAWKKAYEVTLQIYRLTDNGRFAKDYGLRDQIRRASVSIMANIAEGQGRKSNLEFANFLNMARGSAHEVQSHLHIAVGLEYISKAEFDFLHSSLAEISKMTIALAKYLRQSKLTS